MRPWSIYLTCTDALPHAVPTQSRNYQLSLPRPRTDIFKTSIAISSAFLWNNLPTDNQILLLVQLLQANISCTSLGGYIEWIVTELRQTDRQTETERQTDRQTEMCISCSLVGTVLRFVHVGCPNYSANYDHRSVPRRLCT